MDGRGQGWTILGGLRKLGARFVLELCWDLARGRRRSIAEDAGRIVAFMDPSPRVEGAENIPRSSPFVLVANHYQAEDLWVGWVAAALTHVVAAAREPDNREIHWLVTSEWGWIDVEGLWIPNPATTLLFPRAAYIWGMIPISARPHDIRGRALALRRALAYLGRAGGAAGVVRIEPVAVFPEGRASLALQPAVPGSGAFLYKISNLGVPIIPAAAFQENRGLVLRFGKPFSLKRKPPGGRQLLDDWARTEVMVAIGQLLPPQLWGVYAADISARRGRSIPG